MTSPFSLDELASAGFAIASGLLPEDALEALRGEADRILRESPERGGARNALGTSSLLRELGREGPPARWAREVLGEAARPTKLTVFDKSPRANWKVPWHQDLTLTVAERREVEGYGPWSLKGGVPHVQPPVAILEATLAFRLHLDDTQAANGALRVLPGSHRLGRLAASEIEDLRGRVPEVVCPVSAGGAMLLFPLLVHASSPARTPSRRRVLHFEYCAASLAGGLSWG